MATKITQFKSVQLTKDEAKNIKAGYADTGFGGTGGNGFIIWDDLDPRDEGFALSTMTSVAVSFLGGTKKKKFG